MNKSNDLRHLRAIRQAQRSVGVTEARPTPGPIWIGLDFGTSHSKACVYDPGGEHAEVCWLADDGPIARSWVHVAPSGALSTAACAGEPSDGTITVRFLKMELAGRGLPGSGVDEVAQAHEMAALCHRDEAQRGSLLIEALAAYYLSTLLNRILVRNGGPEASRDLVVRLGVPVQDAEDHEVVARFRQSLSTALEWSAAPPATLADAIVAAQRTRSRPLDERAQVIPEVEALFIAVHSQKAVRRDATVIVDVGGGTVDVVACQLVDQPMNAQLNLPGGSVGECGVALFAPFFGGRTPEEQAEAFVSFGHGKVKGKVTDPKNASLLLAMQRQRLGPVSSDCTAYEELLKRVESTVAVAVSRARSHAGLEWTERDGPIDVFMVGGGASAEVIRCQVGLAYRKRLYSCGVRRFEVRTVPNPTREALTREDTREPFGRFLVAFGLARMDADLVAKGRSALGPCHVPSHRRTVRPDYLDSKDTIG